MNEYHKIQTVWKRDPDNNFKTLLENQFALPEFEYLKHNTWAFTEKVDGTNIRVMFDGQNVTFGGKTDRAQLPAPLVQALEQMFLPIQQRELLKEQFPDGVCLYGEGYGGRIQSGGKYRSDQSFVLFDIRIGNWWLERDNVQGIAETLGIDVVPVIGYGNLHDMVSWVRDGFMSVWGDFQAEGIVARPTCELTSRNGSRIITKVKCKDFA